MILGEPSSLKRGLAQNQKMGRLPDVFQPEEILDCSASSHDPSVNLYGGLAA